MRIRHNLVQFKRVSFLEYVTKADLCECIIPKWTCAISLQWLGISQTEEKSHKYGTSTTYNECSLEKTDISSRT